MHDEPKHVKSLDGNTPPSDIFKPYRMGVELFSDMDEIFRRARQMAAGERRTVNFVASGPLTEAGEHPPNMVAGQRAVAIVTPGRLIMLDPCPEPNTVPEEKIDPMGRLLSPDPPLTITAISHTRIEALTTDMNKAIPFRDFLNAWAYAGHNVVVFEGHPSAFESGIRDSDVLLIDSGMTPFVQFNCVEVAYRVMHESGRIFIHDRETSTLSLVSKSASLSNSCPEADYAELLQRFLMRGSHSSIEITAGERLPDLAELLPDPEGVITRVFPMGRDKVDPELVINILLSKAGWRWYTPFKTTGVISAPVLSKNGRQGTWKFRLTLGKSAKGRKQLVIER